MEPLGWEELVVVLPPGDPLRDGDGTLALTELANRERVLFERERALAGLIDELCAAEGFTPRAAVRTAQIAAVPVLASAGLGLALVPVNIVAAVPLGPQPRAAPGARAVRLHARGVVTARPRVPRARGRAAVAQRETGMLAVP